MIDSITESVFASPVMNHNASALGKLGRGIPKTLTPAEIERRTKRLLRAAAASRARKRRRKRTK